MNAQFIFDSGQLMGLLLKYSVEQWEDFAREAKQDTSFHYAKHIELLARVRKEMTGK